MARRKSKLAATTSLILAALGFLFWQFGPGEAVFAIANLSDPAKLATLEKRGANPRVNKIVYWIDHARRRGLTPDRTLRAANFLNWTSEPRAGLVREELTRNLAIADELGLLTADNREKLRNGHAAIVTRGPYEHAPVEIDHIVPVSLAPEIGNELANLEMLPKPLNRAKSAKVGERQLAHAERLRQAGLLTEESLQRVQAQAR